MRNSELCQYIKKKKQSCLGEILTTLFHHFFPRSLPTAGVMLEFLYFLGAKPFGSLSHLTRLCYQHPCAGEICGSEGVYAYPKLVCGSHLPLLCSFRTVLLQVGLLKRSKFKIILFRNEMPIFPVPPC